MPALLAWLIPLSLSGQVRDFQTWYEAEVHKGVGEQASLSLELEQRLKNNSLNYDRTLLTLAGEYDIRDHLEASGGIRAFLDSGGESGVQMKYRLHLDASGDYPIRRFELSLRVRMQYGLEAVPGFGRVDENRLVNRNRLRATYDIFGSRFEIGASAESWHPLDPAVRVRFTRMRYSALLSCMLNFRSELNLRYILEDEFNRPDPLTAHILIFGYSFDL